MFRRARLSVKPNVRPSAAARGSAASSAPRAPETPKPPEPAAPSSPRPPEPQEEAPADAGGTEPREKAPSGSFNSDEKTDGENDVEESSKSSSIVSQKRKRISSISSPVKPNVSVPSEPQPLSAVNPEAPAPKPIPTTEKQPCSDRYRIYKAQKLREMLKEELRKEKKQWKNKYAINESQGPPDRSKMTMRDFIYYLPDNNPMASSLEQEKRTEKSVTTAQTREQENKSPPDTEDNDDIEEETDDGPLLVPRVKVAEDGTIILDEESLTVEVLRTKGPCVVEENDPIFERGSTTTYSSFRKNYYSKPWSNKETDMFFLAISMVGTDFSMIGQLFPHRARIEIKNKFKREEKTNGWRIDKAFQEKRPFDFDFFAHLLQKVLAEEEKRKQKAVKSQHLKEKKSSKTQKTVKVKKVAGEGISDELHESIGTKVSDTEGSQKDAQIVEEQSSASSEQDSGQVTSESDLSQDKKRKKNQNEIGEQAATNLSENATVQPEPSEGEKHNDNCQSLRPEINEDEGNKEQMSFCIQNSDDVSFSSEKLEQRTDSILLSSCQQDSTPVGGEILEARVSDTPSSEVAVGALCDVNIAEGGSTEERTVAVETKTQEDDQVENVIPKVRGRLQRPKPNLSRAVGKKPVFTQDKTVAESKSLHPETSVEKSNMEKEALNTADISQMENTEEENPEAHTISNSSEKICPQEDDQPKVNRPARVRRGRFQRPKPNISKVADRKETQTSENKNGANEKTSDIESHVNINTPEQVEDQLYENVESDDILQPEKNNISQNIQIDEPKASRECLSRIQEDGTSNTFKHVPILKTRFKKPKPNIGRGSRKKETSSKEEVPEEILSSQKMTAALTEIARLEISPGEEVPVEVDTAQEMNSHLKESGIRATISPEEEILETVDTTEEMETDLKETGMEISQNQIIPEMSDVIEEKDSGFKETEAEISPRKILSEVIDVIEEKELDMNETGDEITPCQSTAEMIEITEKGESIKDIGEEITSCQRIAEVVRKESNLKEIEDITPCQGIVEMIEVTEGKGSDLKETGEEITPGQRIAEIVEITDEKESDLKETGDEITPSQRVATMIEMIEGKESDLKEIEKEITPGQKIIEMTEMTEGKESDLKETEEIISCQRIVEVVGREADLKEIEEITPCQGIEITEKKDSDLKGTGQEITPSQNIVEMIEITEKGETDLKETEDFTPYQSIAEMIETVEGKESDLKESGEEIIPSQNILEMIEITEERETDLKETDEITPCQRIIDMIEMTEGKESDLKESGKEVIPSQRIAEIIEITEKRETDLKEIEEIIPCQQIAEEIEITKERETDMKETGGREIPQKESVQNEVNTFGDIEIDLIGTGKEISLREKALVEINAIGQREIFMKEIGKGDVPPFEKIPGKMTAIEERKADLKGTQGDISLMKSQSEEIGTAKEMVADSETTPVDTLRKNETEKTGTLRQTETNLTQDSGGDCSAAPSLNASNISSEFLPMAQTSIEEKTSFEMEISSSVLSLQISDHGKTEDQRMQSTDIQEQFSDINLRSLPQEQKPEEVKPAPFVRSRFKRPKPNLARAALRRETMEAKKPVPGKNVELSKTESVVMQQNASHVSTIPSQHDVASLMTSQEEDDKSCRRGEGSGPLPCIQTEQDLSLPSSGDPIKEAKSTQEEDVAVSMGTQNINTLQQEMKESTTQGAIPVRGRLQRPRPNIKKAGWRQVATGIEDRGGIIQEERTVPQKEEAEKKSLNVANSQLGIEIEVVSSKISECRMNDILDEQKSPEHKAHVPSPAPLVRRQFQKVKPNLGRAHGKKEEHGLGKNRAGQSMTKMPEESLLHQGHSNTHLPEKEKTSHEISARDCAGPTETRLTKRGAQSEVRSSVNIGERTVGDNSLSSIIKEQHLNKLPSCPQLLNEPNCSKTALDRRTASSSTSEREIDRTERRLHRKIKSNPPRGRGSKRVRSKAPKKEPRPPKSMLVTLRASQEEDEDDVDDFELDYEEENYHLAPEEVNKAPVFVPIGLRSPEPVASQIEETMEELEIPVNVPDVGCIAVVEQELPNTDVSLQDVKPQDISENMLTVCSEVIPDCTEELILADSGAYTGELNPIQLEFKEVTMSEHTQDETGSNDGSTEAAITLLTMGDLLLQSEISTEQGEVGICVLPDVQSRDKNHIPFSPDHVNHSIMHECQDLSSLVTTTSLPSLQENTTVLEGQSTIEKADLMEKTKEDTLSNRNTASEVTNTLRMRRRFAKPKVNLKKILGTNRVGAHRTVSSLSVNKEKDKIQRETEKNASNASELEDNLGAVTSAESQEQSSSACVHGMEETTVSQQVSPSERNEEQEEETSQQIFSVVPAVSMDSSTSHTLGSSEDLGSRATEVPLDQSSMGNSTLMLQVPECISTSIPEIQEENVISSQDLTVNVVTADTHQDNEDDTFILTLVEIPTNEVEFADTTTQLMPNPLLPAPILVKSVNAEERGDMSMNFPLTLISEDAMCSSNSGRESEKPPASLDMSRKRLHCSLDESDSVPPAKRSSFTSIENYETYSSEVCSKELVNVFEETGLSHMEHNNTPTSGSIPTTSKSQKRQLESSTFQSKISESLDKIRDRPLAKTTSYLPQDKMGISDKEEKTCSSKSEQMDNRLSSSKTSLSRPGRRPLGFLSLICSKSSLESDEPAQFHKNKRPKPLIPMSRKNLKRLNPASESQKTNTESSDVLPSPSSVNTPSTNLSSTEPDPQVSCDHSLLEEKSKGGPNRAPGQEATTVSEYFFGDIFIEVDERE